MKVITPPTNRAKPEPFDKTNAGNPHTGFRHFNPLFKLYSVLCNMVYNWFGTDVRFTTIFNFFLSCISFQNFLEPIQNHGTSIEPEVFNLSVCSTASDNAAVRYAVRHVADHLHIL